MQRGSCPPHDSCFFVHCCVHLRASELSVKPCVHAHLPASTVVAVVSFVAVSFVGGDSRHNCSQPCFSHGFATVGCMAAWYTLIE